MINETISADPFLIAGPALISYSGGRTSAYMLYRILEAHGGQLPADVHVVFANTGKERPETLDFVQACAQNWGVRVVWLEWIRFEGGAPWEDRFEFVSHNSASRNGEPFQALVDKKQYLPNPVARFCTIELKIRTMKHYALSIGWEHWTNVIGFRADEPGRVAKALDPDKDKKERWNNACPLAHVGVTEDDVLEFWRGQPFDLGLKSYEGNCDLCFLKGAGKIDRIMRDNPDLADWWITQEQNSRASKPEGARFRTDRMNYAQMLDLSRRQGEFDFTIFDDYTSCDLACTD